MKEVLNYISDKFLIPKVRKHKKREIRPSSEQKETMRKGGNDDYWIYSKYLQTHSWDPSCICYG